MRIWRCLQFGFAFEGLATTKPAPAPGTSDPSGPMLFKAPCNAISLSAATNDAKSRFATSAGAADAWEQSSETSAAMVLEGRCMAGRRWKRMKRGMKSSGSRPTLPLYISPSLSPSLSHHMGFLRLPSFLRSPRGTVDRQIRRVGLQRADYFAELLTQRKRNDWLGTEHHRHRAGEAGERVDVPTVVMRPSTEGSG